MKLHIVATIVNGIIEDECDAYADIVLVTPDKSQAQSLFCAMAARAPHEGLDYDKLVPFEDVIIIERELGKVM